MGDPLQTLPTDKEPMNPHEQILLNAIFKEETSSITKLFQEMRIPIIAGILFLVLSIPQTSVMLKSVVPYVSKSEVSLVLFKTILFIGTLFVALMFLSK